MGEVDFFDVDDEVDAVENRARKLAAVAFEDVGRTSARMNRVAKKAARARVHGGDEHKIGRVEDALLAAADGNGLVFKGLAECLKKIAWEFGKLIQKEDAVVSERDFAREGVRATTEQSGGAGGVMRGAKRALSVDLVGRSAEGMEFSNRDGLLRAGWR